MKRTIIQLARYGDILSILPICRKWARAGDELRMVVCPAYLPLFDSISYVEPVAYDAPENDVEGAKRFCQSKGLPNPIAFQVNDGKPHPIDRCRNFIVEQWTRAGETGDFHRLPLILDARDKTRDAEIGRQHVTHHKTVAYCLAGHSSQCEQAQEIRAWIVSSLGSRYPLLDIGALKLASIADLHPILQRCRCLITIDSGPLHLSHASRVPTIVLQRSATWYQSEPRWHWIERLTYEDAVTHTGRKRIAAAVDGPHVFGRLVIDCPAPRRIIHVVSLYHSEADTGRLARARGSWAGIGRQKQYVLDGRRHSGVVFGDSRQLPFVRDIFDFACDGEGDKDIILYTNADIGLAADAAVFIRDLMGDAPCFWSARAELPKVRRTDMWRRDLLGSKTGYGSDVFGFTPRWWSAIRHRMPDMVIGAEGWDAIMRWIMRSEGGAELWPAVSWHQDHKPAWAEDNAILTSPAQRHNRQLAAAWAVGNGYGHLLGEGRYLFKAETT